MLQFPYAVNPNNSQAVDGTVDNKFTCIISGTICTAYQIEILNNNTNEKIYGGEKTSIIAYNLQEIEMNVPANSFTNGNDLIWKMRLWTNRPDMLVVSGNTLKSSTTTEIKVREYTQVKVGHIIEIGGESREIKGYSAGTITVDALSKQPAEGTQFKIYSDFIDTPYYFFKSRSKPVVEITNYTEKITDRKYKFTGSYTQAENVSVQYFVFNLYSGDEIIDTTGEVFSANFEYEFDGFSNGQNYDIEFICMSQDSVEVSSGKKNFSAEYQTPNIESAPDIKVLCDKDAVSVSWNAGNQSIPKTEGNYEIIKNFPFSGTNSVAIESGGYIEYDTIEFDPLSIDEDNFTVLVSVNLNDDFFGNIIELGGGSKDCIVYLEGNTFYYKNGDSILEIGSIFESNDFLLQPSPSPKKDYGYFWYDDRSWNDSYYYVESISKVSEKQYKITIKPNSASIERLG